ncbi:MAG: hypothetical protein AVDCRST_MAG49-3628 [uncultured Thermomicrobiales bacterium]|uniref:Uncharacterized protein n=1 Tax=uncultured Thermomicrobiales bacterium TaxID=1645740 RepID=A0A6J4V9M8_9BACT|nr:MAG: hypothetical protein AVDCRST_MAG49-3628 [uncultured Thermomicrobiales bacterium]
MGRRGAISRRRLRAAVLWDRLTTRSPVTPLGVRARPTELGAALGD